MRIKRFIAAALSCAVLACSAGIAAAAQTAAVQEEVGSFEAFKAALEAGTSIKLSSDFAMNKTVNIVSKEVVLDLNGHTITADTYMTVTENSSMTITDSSPEKSGKIDFTSDAGDPMYKYDDTHYGWIYVKNSVFTLDGGELSTAEQIDGCGDAVPVNPNAILLADKSEITVNGGTLTLIQSSYACTAVCSVSSHVTFNDGVINGHNTHLKLPNGYYLDRGVSLAFAVVQESDNASVIDIKGGDISAAAIFVLNDNTSVRPELNISGGNIQLGTLTMNGAGSLNITGGNLKEDALYWQDSVGTTADGFITAAYGSEAKISGNAVIDGGVYSDGGSVEISGGTFTIAPDESYFADGCTITDNGDGTYSVNAPAPAVSTGAAMTSEGTDGSVATGFVTSIDAKNLELTSIAWDVTSGGVKKSTGTFSINPITINGSASIGLIIGNLSDAAASAKATVNNSISE